CSVPAARTARAHPPGDGAGSRGVAATGGSAVRHVAEPRALLRRGRESDAADSDPERRARHAEKRGGDDQKLYLDEVGELSDKLVTAQQPDLIALDDALNDLATVAPQQSRVVELRFFGGLSIEETAEVLGISPATVKREWNMAKAWLHREISKQ